MKPSILSITVAALFLVSCDNQHRATSVSTASETADGNAQSKLRAGGLELSTTGTRTSYAPQDDDQYVEFLLTNVSGEMMPFQAAVGTAFDQSHRAVFISICDFSIEGGRVLRSVNHYPLTKTAAPQNLSGPSVELQPGKTIRLDLRVGSPGLFTDPEWKVLRPDAKNVVFVIHGIPSLCK